jgi:tRNA threonylcarbamoyladenosine biosynthesis protein TsaE
MDKYKTIITESAEETKEFGEALAHDVGKRGASVPHIICLYGDLGLGKTTFVQGFAKGLGIPTRLLSPTFIIVRRYQLEEQQRFLYHLDLYRIKEAKDMATLGLEEIFTDTNNIVVIEWADRLGALLPKARLDMRFSSGSGEQERRIETSIV